MGESGPRHVDPVAIVGIGCRFPGGANDAASFWSLLTEGRCAIREVPPNRWNVERYYDSDPAAAGAMVMQRGGFVDNLDAFDAAFWGISPREALRMDPQQRWLLEVAWEAIEDAGVAPSRLRGRPVGVFVGISGNDYGGLQLRGPEDVDAYTNSGSTASIASNRISYMLDLRGPSLSIDTACSSSLVAVATACENIWAGRCEGALAGGVNALISPQTSIGFSKASMISPTGQCFAFDARANGFVRAEGAALVYLKPLAGALAAGDRVYAVIRAAVVNQDGHTSSMTVPGIESQAAMLEDAYRQAGIPASRVVYVEAHGTGTPVGDPIEATALGQVLGKGRSGRRCLIGSVKTNIGHLESGSGVAGLIKAALILSHRMIPATLNFEQPNPNIAFDDLGLEVAAQRQPLPEYAGEPPVVAVNSFGFGGTNAHAVLEAAPHVGPLGSSTPGCPERPCLLPISARDAAALRVSVQNYRELLGDASTKLADICDCAANRKEHHHTRLVLIADSVDQMRAAAAGWLRDGAADGVVAGRIGPHSPPVFVFAGQGPQWWGMGRQLFAREPVVRDVISEIDARIQRLAGWSLLTEMMRPESESIIDQTHIAQPAIFALQVALVELWKTWGIRPAKVIGHSVGEVAAAYCAGVYSLADAVHIITNRARLQHTAFGGGRMLAAAVSEEEARQAIGSDRCVALAAINSPRLMTLAGDVESLELIDRALQQSGVFTRWLRGRYAFHSAQMDPIREDLLEVLDGIDPQTAQIPLISTVTAAEIAGESLDADYWWQNIRRPVMFGPAVSELVRRGDFTFLEVSPHPVLESSIKECLAEQGRTGLVFHSLRRDTDESRELALNLAGLHVLGIPIAWDAVNRRSGVVIPLPHYPWNRETFWIESADSKRIRIEPAAHPLLGQRLESARPTWQLTLDLCRFPYLNDHRVWDTVVFPAAAYGEMGLALGRILFPEESHAVENLEIRKALFLREGETPRLQSVFDPADKSFAIYSSRNGAEPWDVHAQGTLSRQPATEAAPGDLDSIRERLTDELDHGAYCRELVLRGYQFGPAFRQVQRIWRTGREVLISIEAPRAIADAAHGYFFHPAIQDACFHALVGLPTGQDDSTPRELFLPQGTRRLHLRRDVAPGRLFAHALLTTSDGASMTADIRVFDEDGRRVADILGFRMEHVDQKRQADDLGDCYYRFEWQPHRLRGSGLHGACSFLSSTEIARDVAARIADVEQRHGLEAYYREFVADAEAAVSLLARRAFVALGWKPVASDRVELDAFMHAHGISEDYRRVTRRLLRHLEQDAVLRNRGEDQWEVLQPPGSADCEAVLDTLAERYPACVAEIELFRRAGLNLASVLSGVTDPLELLFPAGSHEVMERFYSEALGFPAHLELTRAAVAKAVASMPPRRTLRVLEVGAGTGVLSRAVLPVLPDNRTEYLFTDVGASFVAAARKRFADVPFIDYQVFDLESDPERQGIPAGQFDLILGADVVHATADLRVALRHLRQCLAPGGLLMLLELVKPAFVRDDVTFGLLRGYSRFTDTDLRPYSALAAPPQWQQALAECGFTDVQAVSCGSNADVNEHALIAGFAPNVVRSGPERQPAEPGVAAMYAIFADAGGVGDSLSARLRERGRRTVIVRRGDRFVESEDACFVIRDDSAEDIVRVLAAASESGELAGVIHCWSLDRPDAAAMTIAQLRAAQQTGSLSAFRVIGAAADSTARAWFVTRGLHRVVEGDRVEGLASAPIVGLARVANNEQRCRFTTIDLESCSADESAEHLLDEVTLPGDGELETAYRGGTRHVLRLVRVAPGQLPHREFNAVGPNGAMASFRLHTDTPGILSNLALHETRRHTPRPHEIEVRVCAGGINFRDVMKALGTHPGNPEDLLWFGDDFSGVVERVGNKVTTVKVGDEVAGMAPYAFRSYATTDERMAFCKPADLTFAQAATIPTVFLTAHYAINHLARMQPGESILIHAGSGGVGQAAIQIAQHLSLKVFATAGSPEKRRMLTEMGVDHVMNSRTLEFADEIMEVTGGRGVDAVLNSLAGDFIPKSLSVLAPFGRFLEIGKVDIYRNARIGLHPLRNNISYFVIDLTQHLRDKPAYVVQMFAEIAERFASGDYRPIPYTSFPISRAAEAFRFMAQGKHVGKNVLTFDHDAIPIRFSTDPRERFKADATYLITGGAGGVGLEVARWIAGHGGKHLVLMSRSGPRDSGLREIEQLRSGGTTVIDARGDVSNPDDVRRVVEQTGRELPRLRGVFHAAMVLDDALITELDERRVQDVLEPKMSGAWNLHTATETLELDHFVCFSSFSNVIGMLRQSNYNAGNAFLDALAHYRRGRGLPALTINWGAILGTGFVERNQKTADALVKLGFGSFRTDEVLRALDFLLVVDPINVVASRVDWQAVLKLTPMAAASPAYAAVMRDTRNPERAGSIEAQLRAASAEQQERLLEQFIAAQVAGVFGTAEEKVDRSARLTDLGLDSLMTLELTNRLERELGIRIPMATLLGGPTIVELARAVRQLLAPGLATAENVTQAKTDEPPATRDDAAGHLVTIKRGIGLPVFCFHPVGGGVGIYAGLVPHVPENLPLYGVETRLLRGNDEEYATLESMVDAYAVAVRTAHQGPYRLIGFSLGGYLAARVAERLENAGELVECVGVIDWDARQKITPEAQRESLVRLSLASYVFLQEELGILRPRPEHQLRDEIAALVDRVSTESSGGGEAFYRWVVDKGLTTSAVFDDVARQALARFEQHCRLLTRELPQPRFRAPLIVWRARDGFGSGLESWERDGGIGREYVFEGDHNSLMRPAALKAVAEQMLEFLQVSAGQLA